MPARIDAHHINHLNSWETFSWFSKCPNLISCHTKSIFRKDFTRSILCRYSLSAVCHTLTTEKIFISSDKLLVIVKLTNSVLSYTEVLRWVIGTLKNVKGCISIGKGCNGHVIATGCSYCRIYEKCRVSLQWFTSKGIFTRTVSCFSARNSIVNTWFFHVGTNDKWFTSFIAYHIDTCFQITIGNLHTSWNNWTTICPKLIINNILTCLG